MDQRRHSKMHIDKGNISPIVLIFGLALLSTSLVIVTADPNILSIQADESGIDVGVVDQPTNNEVVFSNLNSDDYNRIFVYSQEDKLVYEGTISDNQHTVALQDGTYQLEMSNNSGFVIEQQFTV